MAGLPHLATDRYKAHLKAVGVDDEAALRKLVKSMVRLGWVEYFPDDATPRFLRPFHRMFDKCAESAWPQSRRAECPAERRPGRPGIELQGEAIVQIGPTKLIAIRSGSYDYAEIDLSNSIQLVGPNNAGRTTLINTLQFLYLDNRNQMVFGDATRKRPGSTTSPRPLQLPAVRVHGPQGHYTIGWRGQSKSSGGDPVRFTYDGGYQIGDFLGDDDRVRDPKDVLTTLVDRNYRELKEPQLHRDALLVATKGDNNGLGIVHLTETDRYAHFKEILKNLLSLRSIGQHEEMAGA